MDEILPKDTRAIAKLPNLDIEIAHRSRPEEGAEYLAITLRATPNFRAVNDYLEMSGPLGMGGLALFSPLPWIKMAQAFWQPFIPFPLTALTPPSETGDNRR